MLFREQNRLLIRQMNLSGNSRCLTVSALSDHVWWVEWPSDSWATMSRWRHPKEFRLELIQNNQFMLGVLRTMR